MEEDIDFAYLDDKTQEYQATIPVTHYSAVKAEEHSIQQHILQHTPAYTFKDLQMATSSFNSIKEEVDPKWPHDMESMMEREDTVESWFQSGECCCDILCPLHFIIVYESGSM